MGQTPVWAIVVGVILLLIAMLAIFQTMRKNRRNNREKRRRLKNLGGTPMERRALRQLIPVEIRAPQHISSNNPDYWPSIWRAVQKDTRDEVQTRMLEEATAGRGDQIWYSFHVRQGKLVHRALLVHGYRYEIRWNGNRLVHDAQPCAVRDELIRAATTPCQSLATGGHIVCLVGWAPAPKDEVDRLWDKVIVKADGGKLRNGQSQFRRFASLISMYQARDANWVVLSTGWVHTRPAHGLYDPPACVAATWSERISRVRPLLSTQQALVADQNVAWLQHYILAQENSYVTNVSLQHGAQGDREGGSGGSGSGGSGDSSQWAMAEEGGGQGVGSYDTGDGGNAYDGGGDGGDGGGDGGGGGE